MAETDVALAEALKLHQPGWAAPDTSEFMRRQRAELIDIETVGDEDEEEDDFVVDDADRPDGAPTPEAAQPYSDR